MAKVKNAGKSRSGRRAAKADTIVRIAEVVPSSPARTKVFLSWSGERSKKMAQTLRSWLPLALHFVDPWMSEADIDAGDRWADAVAKELEVSNFGIICVTRESANAAWMLFEAGALAKSLQIAKVIPLLLDLDFREITGPLAQFQAKKVDKVGVSEIAQSINDASPSSIPDARLHQLLDALWPQLEKGIAAIPTATSVAKHARPQGEVLEELVSGVRSLDLRIREVGGGIRSRMRRERHNRNVFEMLELSERLSARSRQPIGLLVIASLFRDEAPWLYELALEAYRTSRRGPSGEMHRAVRTLREALQLSSSFQVRNALLDDPFYDDLLHAVSVQLDLFERRFSRSSVHPAQPKGASTSDGAALAKPQPEVDDKK